MGLTVERLRSLLSYDPLTGIFSWMERPGSGSRVRIGDIAGTVKRNGYRGIGIGGRSYLAHRLAWLYVRGEWPESDVDHENLDKADNRFANLRLASVSQNAANTRAKADNSSGLKGVSWEKQTRKWKARIEVQGKETTLGRFDCPAAAHLSYIVAADKAFGEFARAA